MFKSKVLIKIQQCNEKEFKNENNCFLCFFTLFLFLCQPICESIDGIRSSL